MFLQHTSSINWAWPRGLKAWGVSNYCTIITGKEQLTFDNTAFWSTELLWYGLSFSFSPPHPYFLIRQQQQELKRPRRAKPQQALIYMTFTLRLLLGQKYQIIHLADISAATSYIKSLKSQRKPMSRGCGDMLVILLLLRQEWGDVHRQAAVMTLL